MKLAEITKNQLKKFLYIWVIAMIIYSIISLYSILINDVFLSIILGFIAFSIFLIPVWLLLILYFNGKVTVTRQGKHIPNFKHGRIFEYVFFSFLFVDSFLSTAFYAKSANVLYTGLLITVFTMNALFAGYCHYILHFHD